MNNRPNPPESSDKIQLPLLLGWGVGSLGSATLLNAITFLVLFFMVSELGIEPALAGLLIFAGKLYDMVTDPLMGIISDRTRSQRFGRRRPYLFFGGLLSAASFVWLFTPTGLSGAGLIAYMMAGLLLYATGYTMFNVPYLAMPAEMTDSAEERSRLMSFRVVFSSLGILIGGAGAPFLISAFGGGGTGYARMAWIVAALILMPMLMAFRFTASARFTERESTTPPVREQLRLALENRPFLILITSKLLQLIGVASTMSALLFLITLILQRPENVLGFYGITATVGTILSMPAWLKAAGALGKRNTYILSIALYVPVVLSWLLAGANETMPVFLGRAFATGIATGGILLMAQSMLPDAIAYDHRRTGLRREGSFAAVYSFVEKTAFAFGPLVVGGLMSAMGFVREAGADQTEGAILAIQLGAAIIPAACAALSAFVLVPYRIPEQAA